VLAASISGTITDGTNPVAGLEVRLWTQTAKGYSFTTPPGAVVLSDPSGNYIFNGVPAGTYKIDTRMPNGFLGNWGDRWYDVAPPNSNGYVEADADPITVMATDMVMGLNIVVELNGGFDGRSVNSSNVALGGNFARAEWMADRRVHHNDSTKASPAVWLGYYSFRGLELGPTRLILHDPNYLLGDVVRPNITVVKNTAPTISDTQMLTAPTDPAEPNNSPIAVNAAIDGGCFRQVPPQPFNTNGIIGPRNSGDTDWFCFDALATDRYIISASGTLALEDGGIVENPWVDTVVSFWSGTTKLGEDDDNGPGELDSRLDTGVLTANGHYCAAVTTFGDTTWNGTNQGSAGPYSLSIAMGNRKPVISASVMGAPAPIPPQSIMINEGDSVTVDLAFSDPDNNLSSGSLQFTDALMNTLSSMSLNVAAGTQSLSFTASQTAARASPYTLTAQVSDGEFSATVTVIITVAAVNFPPDVPVLQSPDSGISVPTRTPTLVCSESFDVDEETLTYEFELTYGDGGTLGQTGSVVGVTGGWNPDGGQPPPMVYFDAGAIPENSWVSWRARAFDGNLANGYSPWTNPWTFFVDSINDPPTTPVLNKPMDGETVMLQRPTFESTNPIDPEGDAITVTFDISTNASFTNIVLSSPPIPVATGTTVTMWTATMDLNWGGSYFARVSALDARGAQTPYSNVNAFMIRPNMPPSNPTFGAPFASCGSGFTVMSAPTSVMIDWVTDVEMDPITLEVQLFNAADNPNTATPLFDGMAMQTGLAGTAVNINGVTWMPGASYRMRVRASDGINTTAWTECVFMLQAMSGAGGGSGSGGGSAAGGGSGTGGGSASGGGSAAGGGSSGGGSAGGGLATGGGSSATGGSGNGGGSAGGSSGTGGGGMSTKSGCGCAADPSMSMMLLAVAMLLRRRRVH
jgi:hypothetical protein